MEAALAALLQESPTLGSNKARRLGPDWNMREAFLVLDYADQLSFVVDRPEGLPHIEPRLGDLLPVSWIAPSEDSLRERIKIDCPDPALRTTFLSLIGEVLDRVEVTHSSVYLEVSKVVNDWRRALQAARSSVSRSGVIGLFGELTVLRDLVAQRGVGAHALWRGPAGHRHDFAQVNALEVKTYSGTGSPSVTIHGAFQLDPPHGHDLHLISFRVEESVDGETIADIVNALGADGVDIDALRGRTDDHEPLDVDETLRLVIVERRLHKVDDEFPGIRASRLDTMSLKGVARLTYQLLLDACPRPLDDVEYSRLLETL
ncbi:PD-(D/E)XK motif protein [Microbacterium luteolum]|uniref:PD-(D/E)XK motif protein n=1 Tax=Microbacterium luteolum TaxID=69367 RepID=A0ABY7XRW4_MICLT|nr:PD-(D/E)XK motif protein [Microbacterium luteolum]WDM44923.1 PD-(D/E)XK motif protein [Microbacterium luteolum]